MCLWGARLFSCCCARVDFSWIFRTVCDCYSRNWRCDDPCLSKALIQDSLFYSIGVVSESLPLRLAFTLSREQRLVDDLLHIYPFANIWLVGHSLGGALASLLASTYGLPAVAFESPGERLAASRLHIPLPRPKDEHSNSHVPLSPVTHVYHTGDPIPQGVCTGFGSACSQAGYAMETRCHLGKSIVFDTVEKLGWKVDVRKHVIKDVVFKVLEADGVEWEDGRDVPLARREEDCVVSVFDPLFLNFVVTPSHRIVTNGSLGILRMKNNWCIIIVTITVSALSELLRC